MSDSNEIIKKVIATYPVIPSKLSPSEKKIIIEQKFKEIMEVLGLDLNNDSLKGTPKRVAKMYVDEIFSTLNVAYDGPDKGADLIIPTMTSVENNMQSQMVLMSNITANSTCEHHFVTIQGFAHVAYIPNQKVIGLSKINRLVQFLGALPQVQERWTEMVLKTLQDILDTDNVAVVIDAVHYCVRARGIKDGSSVTRTTALGGSFKDDPDTRQEFITSIPSLSTFKL